MEFTSTYMHDFSTDIEISSNRGGGIFKLMNLYLNFNLVNEAATKFSDNKGNISIFEFLKYILDKINFSFGNTLNLVPYINDNQEVVMLNQNPQFAIQQNALPDFDLAGYRLVGTRQSDGTITDRSSRGSIIRDFLLNLKLAQQWLVN